MDPAGTAAAAASAVKNAASDFANAPANKQAEMIGDLLVEAAVTKGPSSATKGLKAAQILDDLPETRLNCFPAGTAVHTSDGRMAIEQIAAGNRVWSYSHSQLCWVERRVVEIYRYQNQGPMATIRVNGETIRVTGGHPFWVVDGKALAERRIPELINAYEAGGRQPGRWVLAIDLLAGDKILRRDGEVSALDFVEIAETEETVYNFGVFELQNYAVGTCGILVHNTNQGTPNAPSTGGGGPKKLPGQWDSGTYPKPPGWGKDWNWGPATGEAEAGWRWFDPKGGEWRFHAPDKWHP